MNKLSVLCITQFIEKFNFYDSARLFDLIQEVSKWFSISVSSIATLKSFTSVQKELVLVAQYIAEGKNLTAKSCNNLVGSLKEMQKEMFQKIKIIAFVTKGVEIKLRDNIEKAVIQDIDECIAIAYDNREALKYLVYVNEKEINDSVH